MAFKCPEKKLMHLKRFAKCNLLNMPVLQTSRINVQFCTQLQSKRVSKICG